MNQFFTLFKNNPRSAAQEKYLNALAAARDPDAPLKAAANARWARIGDAMLNSLFPTSLEMTVNQLQGELRNALIRDSRFRTQSPDGTPGTKCWVNDIIFPKEGDNQWVAVISMDGLNYKIGFTVGDAGVVTLSVLPPIVTQSIWNSKTGSMVWDFLLNADARDPGAATRAAAEGDESTSEVNAEVREAADLGEAGDANAPTREAADKDGINGQSPCPKCGQMTCDCSIADKQAAAEVAFNKGTVGDKTPSTNSESE